jgi:SEC-C motif-containing protein
MNKTNYLLITTLPEQQKILITNNTYKVSNEIKWCKLDIISTEDGTQQDKTGIVEFKAWYTNKTSGLKQYYHEISSFLKQNNCWYFVYPDKLL